MAGLPGTIFTTEHYSLLTIFVIFYTRCLTQSRVHPSFFDMSSGPMFVGLELTIELFYAFYTKKYDLLDY